MSSSLYPLRRPAQPAPFDAEIDAPGATGGERSATHQALGDTYRAERPKLMRYFSRKAGDELAPDLVQEVFARAASSGRFGQLANPGGFVMRIARNLLIDRSRQNARHPAIFLPIDDQRDLATAAEQEHELEAADLLRVYERAVDLLPTKTRRVFLMHRVDELSYREVHERLGISVATVEYHMMKALKHIAHHVDAAR